jgi:hypothetical protein
MFEMKDQTLSALKKLEDADWFSAVGNIDTEAAIVLHSWKEATESCSSTSWRDLLLEASNRYTEKLASRSKERWNQWNSVVREVKKITVPLVAAKTERVVGENRLPHTFQNVVNWDILHIVMESEYSDVFPPGFFASQAYWYVRGHFPCGWSGSFPEGKLIIY